MQLYYDLQKMQELLHDFYTLTNIKTSIHDSSGNELCFYPAKLTEFCASLRSDKEMDERCKECDKRAFAVCKKTHKQYVYTCHAGLIECISPILYDEKLIGYIALGQIKAHGRTDFERVKENLPESLHASLAEVFDELPSLEMEKIYSAMRIIDACTGYEYLKGLVRAAESKIDVTIGGYVDDHLSSDLSVQTLCSKFRLSHSEIYSIFKEYFHSTPAEFIKTRRLNKACDLLKTSTLPVNKISELCGIPDYNYFSKVFKLAFGVSPRTYRKTPETFGL